MTKDADQPEQPSDEEDAPESLPRPFGKYILLSNLASGGMAQLYLAIQRAVAGFEKLVVIKQILPTLTRDQAFVEMLLSEARTAATLNHPNVVQTFDVGEFDGVYYIAMEHIHGEDIRAIVRAMRKARVSSFPLEHTLSIILGVCAGLAYAHDKRGIGGGPLDIVHRDISPQNILVTHSGDVKIVDFGIAKSTEAIDENNSAAGQLKGKIPYMSPEQARAESIDHRSDIFAVGILLFELTTGRRLFKAKSDYDTLRLICDRDYPSPSQVDPDYPPALEAIVTKALSKDRESRYQSARDMQADIERFVREERIAVSSVSLGQWMEMLFEDVIEERKAALHDAKQLADVIAEQRRSDADLFSTVASGIGTGAGTTLDSVDSIAQRHEPKSPAKWLALVATLILVALGFASVLLNQSPAPPTAAEPVASKGAVSITSTPPGAYIRVAGELQAVKTPATVDDLPLGIDLEIKLSAEGYEDHIAKVRLADEQSKATIHAKLVKGTVTLVFDVTPPEATIELDGKPLEAGTSSVSELGTGEHKIVVRAKGHATKTLTVTTKRNEKKRLKVNLVKFGPAPSPAPAARSEAAPSSKAVKTAPKATGSGRVNVASRGGYCSNVVVGGRGVGPTPVAGVTVPAGPVGIVCTLPDGRRITSGAMVKDGQTARVLITIPK